MRDRIPFAAERWVGLLGLGGRERFQQKRQRYQAAPARPLPACLRTRARAKRGILQSADARPNPPPEPTRRDCGAARVVVRVLIVTVVILVVNFCVELGTGTIPI